MKMIRKSFALLVTSLILLWILYPGFAERGYKVLGGQFNVLSYLGSFVPKGSLETALPFIVPLALVSVLASALIIRSRHTGSSSSDVSQSSQIEEEGLPVQLSAVIKRTVKTPRPISEPTTSPKASQSNIEAEEAYSGIKEMARSSWLNGDRCSMCGSANPRNATSCISCGAGLISVSAGKERKSTNLLFINCRECGKDNLPNAIRCSYCGTKLIGKVRAE